MTTTYIETSAIVKLVVAEDGSDRADALWDASDLLATSRLSYVEARAALAAARRSERLTPMGLEDAKIALAERLREVDQVEVTADLVRSAGDLAEEHGLRGYDAVHLASAVELGAADVVVVTWDRDLAEAALELNLNVGGLSMG